MVGLNSENITGAHIYHEMHSRSYGFLHLLATIQARSVVIFSSTHKYMYDLET